MSALYISQTSALRAGQKAVRSGKAHGFKISVFKVSNPDRSVDIGYRVILLKR